MTDDAAGDPESIEDQFDALLEQSSLGSPNARAIRAMAGDDPGAGDLPATGLHVYITANMITPESWLNQERFADFRNAYSYASGRRGAIIGLSKVSPEEAYFIWRCIQTGMERIDHERIDAAQTRIKEWQDANPNNAEETK